MASPNLRHITQDMLDSAVRATDSRDLARATAGMGDAHGDAVRQFLRDLGNQQDVMSSMRRAPSTEDPTLYPTLLWQQLPRTPDLTAPKPPVDLRGISTPEDELAVMDARQLANSLPPFAGQNIFGSNVRTFRQALADINRQLPGIENLSPEDQLLLAPVLERSAILKSLERGTGTSPRVGLASRPNDVPGFVAGDPAEVTPGMAMELIGPNSGTKAVPRERTTFRPDASGRYRPSSQEIAGPYSSEAELFGDDVARLRDQVLEDQRRAPQITRDEQRWKEITDSPVAEGLPPDVIDSLDKSNRKYLYSKSDRVLTNRLPNRSPLAPVRRQRILDDIQRARDSEIEGQINSQLADAIALRAAIAAGVGGVASLIDPGKEPTERQTLADLTTSEPVSMDTFAMPETPIATIPDYDIPTFDEAPQIEVPSLSMDAPEEPSLMSSVPSVADLVQEVRPAPKVAVASPKSKPMSAQEAEAMFMREAMDQADRLRQAKSMGYVDPSTERMMLQQIRHLKSLAAEARSSY